MRIARNILSLYPTEVQKMRIFPKYFCLLTTAVGWMGGGRFHTFYKQNTLQKVVAHLPPIHLRGSVGRKHQHRGLKRRYRRFYHPHYCGGLPNRVIKFPVPRRAATAAAGTLPEAPERAFLIGLSKVIFEQTDNLTTCWSTKSRAGWLRSTYD